MTKSYWNRESDPYQYPGSSVLKNLQDIKDGAALEIFEQRAMTLRLDEAIAAINNLSIDLSTWQTIHRILFQDVYAWAGNIRNVQLAKGDTLFAIPEHIESEAKRVFDAMNAENLAKLDRSNFISRLSYYFGELNVLHPFREGNGRTQKLLFDEIARRAGYKIEWEKIGIDSLLKAVITAFNKQDYSLLEKLFTTALSKQD